MSQPLVPNDLVSLLPFFSLRRLRRRLSGLCTTALVVVGGTGCSSVDLEESPAGPQGCPGGKCDGPPEDGEVEPERDAHCGPETGSLACTRAPGFASFVSQAEAVAAVDGVIIPFVEAQLAELEALAAQPGASCDDDHLVDQARALAGLGETEACLAMVDRCMPELAAPSRNSMMLAYYGAQCRRIDSDFAGTEALLEHASRPEHAQLSGYSGVAFAHARYVHSFGRNDDAATILSRVPQWDEAVRGRANATLELFGFNRGAESEDEVLQFVEDALDGDDAVLRAYMVAYAMSGVLWTRDDYGFVIRTAADRLPSVQLPIGFAGRTAAWPLDTLYSAAYVHDFGAARRLYLAYADHARPRWALPQERNVHTYQQIYVDECAEVLTHGDFLNDFWNHAYWDVAQDWKAGGLTTEEALADLEAIQGQIGDKADVLTLMGELHQLAGRPDVAEDLFLEAHHLCPFYNRSHRGLHNLSVAADLANRDDRDLLEAIMERELEGVEFEVPLRGFLEGAATLDDAQLDAIAYGIRIWAPYTDRLGLYMKHSSEILSLAPGFGFLYGRRTERPGDFRLKDDIRGQGGSIRVVAEVEETLATPYGAYNLAGHELAHQFHVLLPASGDACITQMYENALERDVFADEYSKVNENEYFAQAINYYLEPSDLPPRFGRTQSWLEENDPDMFNFIQSIDDSEGNLAAVQCQIGAGGEPLQSLTSDETVAIPDAANPGAVSVLTAAIGTPVTSVTVRVDIEHTFRGDLFVALVHGSDFAILHDRTGGGEDNLQLERTLDDFDGHDPAGPWVLHVIDTAAQDTGDLLGWSLELR